MHILMIAAENGAVPGGKVGGLGDVIAEIPRALAKAGHQVSVITPGYDVFVKRPRDQLITRAEISFAGRVERVSLFQLNLPAETEASLPVKYFAIEHPLFCANGPGKIYSEDDRGPFATDAQKFALFCSSVCHLVKEEHFSKVDVLHCHDWHTAPIFILQKYADEFKSLRKTLSVFSIHNLAYQGIRPLRGHDSSFESWFPNIKYNLEMIGDNRYPDCVNLMRAGINLADKVHTVSPTYAGEILRPSDPGHGFIGGEGLEDDLKKLAQDKRLIGILNGCDYNHYHPESLTMAKFWQLVDRSLDKWASSQPSATASHHYRSHYFSLRRLLKLSRQRKPLNPIFISVGRLTDQKLKLLTVDYGKETVLEALLRKLDPGVLLLLGSGDEKYEHFLTSVMSKHPNFLFLCGFSEPLSRALYELGDLFLMPSSFEPCGISQLLAMRSGMPCLVHEIGGLKDTVINNKSGFTFDGDSEEKQANNMIQCVERALNCYHNQPEQWREMREYATKQRFTWDAAARRYANLLYAAKPDKGKLKLVAY